jgi:hypothetical protein
MVSAGVEPYFAIRSIEVISRGSIDLHPTASVHQLSINPTDFPEGAK